jgi:parallel beta-helix repeat protein
MEGTMTRTRTGNKAAVCASAFALLISAAMPAQAAIVWVENYGVDSGACGTLASPCRSISQAIQNASPLDVLLVGPGVYGDIDYDGAFTTPGDEASSIGVGCDCMILVDKQLTILGRRGSAVTVIRYGVSAGRLVAIRADRVVFRGFTLTGNRTSGLGLEIQSGTLNTIVLNRAVAAGQAGFYAYVGGNRFIANESTDNSAYGFVSAGNVTVGNLAIRNQTGFSLNGTSGEIAANNQAIGNSIFGFDIAGTNVRAVGNQASGSNTGIRLSGGSNNLLIANLASANNTGYQLQGGTGHSLIASSAQGNQFEGYYVSAGVTASITSGNIFGNDTTSNCGIRNASGSSMTATHNFWGAATGPGADPADDVCNGAGSATTTTPFSTVRFP